MNINYILRYQSSDYLSTDDFSAIEIQYSIWKPFFHDLQISLLCVGFVFKRSENFKKKNVFKTLQIGAILSEISSD